jgi:glutaredoxin
MDSGVTGCSERKVMPILVTVYSRHGCHLCEVAVSTLELLQNELDFDIEERFIDGDIVLEKAYGEQVPVIHIDGEHHDFFRVDPERFKSSLDKRRQHQ